MSLYFPTVTAPLALASLTLRLPMYRESPHRTVPKEAVAHSPYLGGDARVHQVFELVKQWPGGHAASHQSVDLPHSMGLLGDPQAGLTHKEVVQVTVCKYSSPWICVV